MTGKSNDITTTKPRAIEKTNKNHSNFTKRNLLWCALACNSSNKDGFDVDKAMIQIEENLESLGARSAIEEMLATQMLSVHRLQQISIALTNESTRLQEKQYFTNTSIKLANTFIQQANLLSRLQGNGGQKIIVEHVEVHQGGQAIVGNINGAPLDKVKK